MSELAIHGGAPIRTEPYPPWPAHDEHERANLLEVLDSNQWWSSQGTEVREFERRWGAFHGTGPAIAVTNGSHARHRDRTGLQDWASLSLPVTERLAETTLWFTTSVLMGSQDDALEKVQRNAGMLS